ncbi:MAG TPA: formate-dependent phosphoribosylglycinamide formyltransferase [Leucothrix mucor]|nr:formate-dependent phosphoribosylglycinamide formyltransferase [Leucothrix mucor]
MQIGTPLSDSALRVMLLGSGELGKEVIISLQRLGVEIIAVDRYENAPGHQVAHRFHSIDMTDAKALRDLIELESPHIVVPEIEAIATDELAKIEAENITEIIPTAKAIQLTMNREGIRCLAAEELGLPTSKYGFASSLDELIEISKTTGFPCIVKPVMSSSGKGQSTAHNEEELTQCWDYAMSGGRVNHGRVILEEMIKFDYEITLLTVRSIGISGEIETSFCEPIGHRQENGDYVESWQPQAMSEVALEKSRDIAKQVTDSLGGRGLFGVELFIKGDEAYFSEVSPRPHDTGMTTMATQFQNEFDLHARAILGLPVNTSLHSTGASAVIYGNMDAEGISFSGLEKALADPDTDLRLFGKPEAFTRRRMGVTLARANDTDTARKKAKASADAISTQLLV